MRTRGLATPLGPSRLASCARGALAIAAAFLILLVGSSRAQAAECMTASDCFTFAEWQKAAADDYSNKAAWFREMARQDFVNAKQWGDKATFAFHAGDGPAALAFKTVADYYSRSAIANAKATDDYSARATFTKVAADNNESRAIFLLIADFNSGCATDEGTGGAGVPACAASRKNCVTKHHPSDPSWVTVCDREYISVCDAQRDGHRTVALWYPNQSEQVEAAATQYDSYGRTTNRNGVRQFCWHERPSGAQPFGVQRFRVCVEDEGCSTWRYPIDG